MITIRHILLPTDLEPASERATAMAVELARTFGAPLTLLHVLSVPDPVYAEGLSWPIQALEQTANDALAKECARITKQYERVDALLRVGPIWERILEVVKEGAIDLVVMGTHGRGGISRLVLGSVAEKVVRLSPVPVLTVRPKDAT